MLKIVALVDVIQWGNIICNMLLLTVQCDMVDILRETEIIPKLTNRTYSIKKMLILSKKH